MLKLIGDYNVLAEQEEDLIGRGPTIDSVSDYLGAINKVTDAIGEMNKSGLDFCSCTIARLVIMHPNIHHLARRIVFPSKA